jgi:hypothetical protein
MAHSRPITGPPRGLSPSLVAWYRRRLSRCVTTPCAAVCRPPSSLRSWIEVPLASPPFPLFNRSPRRLPSLRFNIENRWSYYPPPATAIFSPRRLNSPLWPYKRHPQDHSDSPHLVLPFSPLLRAPSRPTPSSNAAVYSSSLPVSSHPRAGLRRPRWGSPLAPLRVRSRCEPESTVDRPARGSQFL